MKIKFSEYIKTAGIFKMDDLYNPVPLDTSNFFLPRNSLLHYNTYTDNIEGPTSSINMFNVEAKVVVENITTFNGMPIGQFKPAMGVNRASITKKLKAEANSSKIIFPLKSIKVDDYNLLVYNYNTLNSSYKYLDTPMNLYYKWHNQTETIINNINEITTTGLKRNHFIIIDIPNYIPKREALKVEAGKEIRRQTLEVYNTFKLLTFLDLFKYLSVDTYKNSLLSKLDITKLDLVHLIFKYKNKNIVFPLASLFHLANLYPMFDYKDEDKVVDGKTIKGKVIKMQEFDTYLNKVSETQARNLIMFLTVNMMIAAPVNYAQAENKNTLVKSNIKNDDGSYNLDMLKAVNTGEYDLSEEELERLLDNYSSSEGIEIPDNIDSPDTANVFIESDIPEEEVDDSNSTVELDADALREDIAIEPEITNETLEELMKIDRKVDKLNLLANIDKAKEHGTISKNLYYQLTDTVENQDNFPSPFLTDTQSTLGEMQKFNMEDIKITKEEQKLPILNTITDIPEISQGLFIDPIRAMDRKYVEKFHKKALVSSVMKIQNVGLVITDFKISEDRDELGEYQTFRIETVSVATGKKNSNWFKIPTLDDKAEFSISGNKYLLRKQDGDIPIRKIDYNEVVLTSYFGKLFINKAESKLKDFGYWLSKELSLLNTGETPIVTNLISRASILHDVKLPTDYTAFSRYTKGFDAKGFRFDFYHKSRVALVNNDKELLAKIEKNKYTLVASKKDEYLLLDMDNNLYKLKDNQYIKSTGTIFTFIGIDVNNAPEETLTIKVFRNKYPVVLLLSYYLGIFKLLKLLKADYKVVKRNEKYDSTKYLGYTFRNSRLLIGKENKLVRILFSGFGLMSQHFRDVELNSLNKKDTYSLLFSNMKIDKNYINEFTIMKELFVDPITELVLEQLKLPTSFIGLLLKASEALLDDSYLNPTDTSEIRAKSAERLVGFVYSELVRSAREYKNKEEFARANMTIDPYSIWKDIGDDSTSALVKKLNPVDSLKQKEEVTKIGKGGMSKESIKKSVRAYHASAIGTISEATKDSASVGVSSYLSASPNLDNVFGLRTPTEDNGIASRFSTSALLSPFVEYEAGKRAGFISIQNGHVAPIENAELPYIRTLAELSIAYKVGKEFAFMATQDGTITKLTDRLIEVTYKDGTKDSGIIGNWSTRPESNKAFKNTVITDLVLNSTVKTGDAISWNSAFFEKDWLFKNALVYKMATYGNIALSEEVLTNEDSSIVCKSMYSKLLTNVYYTHSAIFKATDMLADIPELNAKLKPDTYLYTIVNSTLGVSGLSRAVVDSLQEIKNNSGVAGKEGVLDYIEIFYNSELSELSTTFQDLIKNKKLVRSAKKVSNQYSVDGRPLMKGQIQLVYYIATKQEAGVGEKAVLANQLKSIIGDVVSYDITTLNGIEIDGLFSKISIENRVVNSAYIMGTTNLTLHEFGKKWAKKWRE